MLRSLGSISLRSKALFLDRDGIVNIDHGYTYQAKDIEFVDDIFSLCRAAVAKGYLIIIVTNQSGIARKYYSRDDFLHLSTWIKHQFWKHGIRIAHTYHCPHHPKITYRCSCRKPRPGMIHRAQRQFGISLRRSIMVGDKASDMKAAQSAKVSQRVLLRKKKNRHEPDLMAARQKNLSYAGSLRSISKLL